MKYQLIGSLLVLATLIASCHTSNEGSQAEGIIEYGDWEAPELDLDQLDFSQIPFKKLSDYGFFKGKMRDFDAADGLMLYEPVSSLFTDYAFKSRFVWIANGNSAQISDDPEGTVEFPDNTVLIKNFYYPVDFRDPEGKVRIIETRLLVKRDGDWEAFPYIWNQDQTDAVYKVVGAEIPVGWIDKEGKEQLINYIVPNKAQCKSCHNVGESMMPIGLKAKHLNHDIIRNGTAVNQLSVWEKHGYLEGIKPVTQYPAMVGYEDGTSSLELRARAYLDINCAHCHRAEGPASTSGLFLNYEEQDAMKLGVFKTPVAAGFGAGSFKYAIFPGKSDESILTYRMGTNLVGAAMPEIGRVTVHHEGLELIKEWIDAMTDGQSSRKGVGSR
ncbi:SO2930 family diheme c-type cytochrome [Belliella marina]|uniref:SO2930 family diheme c-type cytochrome n=1 Tax=Belliella marina TaxID=1644146 RepID=A0ABW4VSP7_9BACT